MIGATIGLPIGALTLGTLRTMLFQVTPFDPRSLGLALLLVLGIGLGAAALPALAATRLPSTTALRYE